MSTTAKDAIDIYKELRAAAVEMAKEDVKAYGVGRRETAEEGIRSIAERHLLTMVEILRR